MTGEVQLATTSEAQELLRQAESDPDNAQAWLRAGKALARAGEGAAADAAFERFFSLAPARRLVAEGAELQRRGDIEGAATRYRDALSREPGNVDALRLLAVASSVLGRPDEAERSARQAVKLAPEFAAAWSNLGTVLNELDRVEEAIDAFRQALQLGTRSAQAHANLANALFAFGDFAQAEEHYRAALKLSPDDAASLMGLGHVLKTIGRQAEAVSAYRSCLKNQPLAGEVWWSLANLKTFRFTVADEMDMQQTLQDPTLSEAQRIGTLFALGKAREDAKDHRAAFSHYLAGNARKRALVKYDPVQTEKINERLRKVFTPELFAALGGKGDPDPAPIFIVGLPRSGSTLLEQILASHSKVDGTAELAALGRVTMEIGRFRSDGVVYPEAVGDLEPADLRALGKAYLARAARYRTGRPRFTDKMPNNFASVGLIALILPNAKIIDARRHPLDSCMGSFKQLFARGQTFTYDLFELAEYYLQYDQLMRWWDEVLPGRVLRVDYENTVLNQEAETRRILDFCDLPFEPACLEFHRTARSVATASSEQVRQPLYAGALGSWRRFAPELADMERHLAPVIESLPAHIRNAGA
jgi:tetratricopeptide (TPR) repeat protein